jgi:hypothetical protein
MIRRWIVFVEPCHRFALVTATGHIELAADRDSGSLW